MLWFRLYLCAWFRFYWGFYEILVFVILICYNLGSEEFDCFLFLSFGKMFLSVVVLVSSLGICGLWFHFLGFYILYVFDFVFLVSCIIEAPYQLCERSTKNGKKEIKKVRESMFVKYVNFYYFVNGITSNYCAAIDQTRYFRVFFFF